MLLIASYLRSRGVRSANISATDEPAMRVRDRGKRRADSDGKSIQDGRLAGGVRPDEQRELVEPEASVLEAPEVGEVQMFYSHWTPAPQAGFTVVAEHAPLQPGIVRQPSSAVYAPHSRMARRVAGATRSRTLRVLPPSSECNLRVNIRRSQGIQVAGVWMESSSACSPLRSDGNSPATHLSSLQWRTSLALNQAAVRRRSGPARSPAEAPSPPGPPVAGATASR